MQGDRMLTGKVPAEGVNDGQSSRPPHGRTCGPTRRSTKGQWTSEEDQILCDAVQRFNGKNWKKIAECFKDRTDVQCLHRWQKVLNPELVKGPWSKEEDEIIVDLVNKFGPKKWSTIAQHLPGRIGKQCRERWHNHLNPGINKEAWTQEEELILIRAHKIYGNKWAELTKFLHGRTDNSIKNHWNSSVKKKLDSYLASGLLDQYQTLPPIVNQNNAGPSSSSRMQSSGDESCPKGEEESECSQSCSQSATELHRLDHFQLNEISCVKDEQRLSKEQYYASLDDVSFSMANMPDELKYPANPHYSHDAETSGCQDYQFDMQDPLHFDHESSGFATDCEATNRSHEMMNVSYEASVVLCGPNSMTTSENPAHMLISNDEHRGASTSVADMDIASDNPAHMLISDDECCRALFSEAATDVVCYPLETYMQGCDIDNSLEGKDPSDVQRSEPGNNPVSDSCPSTSDAFGIPSSQTLVSVPSLLSADGHILVKEPVSLYQELDTTINDGFVYTNEPPNSQFNNHDSGLQDFKVTPPNSFASPAEPIQKSSTDNNQSVDTNQQNSGALCYEPPRFPSLDIPFLSCDLIQSTSDSPQEFSPFGIRQLMMSSTNSMTPLILWDSPSREGSPEAVLKNARKSFISTPSILKKRHRDLLSPLSERSEKKLQTHMTSTPTHDFSDVMLKERATHKASILLPSSKQENSSGLLVKDKENRSHALDGKDMFLKDKAPEGSSDCKMKQGTSRNHLKITFNTDTATEIVPGAKSENPEGSSDCTNSDCKLKQGTSRNHLKVTFNTDTATEVGQQPHGALSELNVNDLMYLNSDQFILPSTLTPRNQRLRSLVATSSNQAAGSEFSHGRHFGLNSPSICTKGESQFRVVTGSDNGVENYSIETPLRRSLESPSAWKSPWFINSFVPGPKVDTDISIEDIAYYSVDRSYDAIALMNKLSERSASAYADALEVLGDETPETLLKRRQLMYKSCMAKGSTPASEKSLDASNVSTEPRTLDFSDCGTPKKVKAERNAPSKVKDDRNAPGCSTSYSSPSSYLLKGCR